jgi:hypothetical protein
MAGVRTFSIILFEAVFQYARWRSYVKLEFKGQQSVEKPLTQAVQKGLRCGEPRRRTRMRAEG